MGALAPISPWIPEDDLLLKNSVEAGASLESLAKGAVRFSRRFTLHELQERWYSLLYDPVVSEHASTRMAEILKCTSNLSSKSEKVGVSKDSEGVSGKRKEESVRGLYYAMRKRICTEPCSSIDLAYLVAPSLRKCTGNGEVCQDEFRQLKEQQDDRCVIGDPITEVFELQDSDFDVVRHAFPQIAHGDNVEGNICQNTHAFHFGHMGSFEGDLPDGMMDRDCLYGFSENVPPFSVTEAVGNNMGHSFDQHVHKDIPDVLGGSMSVFENNTVGVQKIRCPGELPVSAYDSITNNPQNVCSGFEGNQDFSSTDLDCGPSFHQLGFSSSTPAMPEITMRTMQIDDNLSNKDKSAGCQLALPPDGGNNHVRTGCQLKERESGDLLANSTSLLEGDLADLSDMNFTHEDVLLFMDDDSKDMLDKSCLDGISSVLFSSPNDTHRNVISDISGVRASTDLEGFTIANVARSLELDVVNDLVSSSQLVCDSKTDMSTTARATNLNFPEYRNGVICCVLNTEDPDIPCNDNDFTPNQVRPSFVTSSMQLNHEDSSVPQSTKDLPTENQKISEQGSHLVNEGQQTSGIVSLQKIEPQKIEPQKIEPQKIEVEPQVFPEVSPSHSINGCTVISETVDSDTRGDPSRCRSLLPSQNSSAAVELNKEYKQVEPGKHSEFENFLLEKQIHASDYLNNQPEANIDDSKQEDNVPDTIQVHAESIPVEMEFQEHTLNPSIPNQEQQFSEMDDDIPSFSDVEAMILDMDLDPANEDLSMEVASYQYEDTKRSIMKLEQSANSYMQRAVASQKAFAIFYGRHLKYYIKKPEVLLGRGTGDVSVDIDLGREGRANKISRRQAIIKMEKDGSFYLKNLGKCSLIVNSTELPGGHRLKLSSSCLIEIRDMKFLFEVNHYLVTQYLAKTARKTQHPVN